VFQLVWLNVNTRFPGPELVRACVLARSRLRWWKYVCSLYRWRVYIYICVPIHRVCMCVHTYTHIVYIYTHIYIYEHAIHDTRTHTRSYSEASLGDLKGYIHNYKPRLDRKPFAADVIYKSWPPS